MSNSVSEYFDDEIDLFDEQSAEPVTRAVDSRRRLEEYMEMKRLREFLEDDYDYLPE